MEKPLMIRHAPCRRGRGHRLFLLAGLLLGLATLLAACQPREIVPSQVSRLLPPEREAVQYRRLVLPNRMKVMLVSNPSAIRSAASLAVGVGSLADSKQRQGMAHFLEHMLFLGTRKYPQADGYSRFLSSNAGSSNAYTADDHTNYFFSVSHGAFEEGLDRFAQFFIAPLLDTTYAVREMNAVASEHAKNIESDYWRIRQVQRNHYRADHPINRFSTGNRATLDGVGNDELVNFYRGQYSANRMTLALAGNRSLDELEALVRGRFDHVPDRNLAPLRFDPEYLERSQSLRLLRIRPVADLRRLTLHFPLPEVTSHFDSKPLSMIGVVLGHEGQGSLLSLLKEDGLALSLSAGGSESTNDYASLEISVALTEKGLANYREVIKKVLGTIAGLREKGIPRYLFTEQQTMTELEHRFQQVPESSRLAARLAAMMQRFPLDALPHQPFLLTAYKPALYRKLLERLTPDNMMVILVAKDLATDRQERFYGTRYSYRTVAGAEFEGLQAVRPDPRWHLPKPNPFIPDKVTLREPEGPLKLARTSFWHLRNDGLPAALISKLAPLEGSTYTGPAALIDRVRPLLPAGEAGRWLPLLLKDSLPLPVRVLDSERGKVWYLPDWRLRQPKAELLLKFYVADAYRDPRQVMLRDLYTAVMEEQLNELGYPIKEAGLHYNIRSVKGGIALSIGGYSARLPDLLQVLVERLRRVSLSQEIFANLKETLLRELENEKLEQPYHRSRYYTDMLLETPNFTLEARQQALRSLSLDDVKGFAGTFLRSTYLEGVVVGNLSRGQARAAIHRTLDTLQARVLPPGQRVREAVRLLPARADWMFTQRVPVNNSVMNLLYMGGETEPRLRGAMLIISKPLGQQFYFHMRTRQQLGYVVWAGLSQLRKKLFFNLLVQSGDYPADELLRRMEAFIPEFLKRFRAMPDSEFERYRQAVIQAKLRRETEFSSIANRLFWMAFRYHEHFDYVSQDIAAVESLTRAEVEAVLTGLLAGENRRRLAIRLVGKGHSSGPPKGQVVRLPPGVRAKAG